MCQNPATAKNMGTVNTFVALDIAKMTMGTVNTFVPFDIAKMTIGTINTFVALDIAKMIMGTVNTFVSFDTAKMTTSLLALKPSPVQKKRHVYRKNIWLPRNKKINKYHQLSQIMKFL